jgi:hypothetical protein
VGSAQALAAENPESEPETKGYPVAYTVELGKNRFESVNGESVTCKRAKGNGRLLTGSTGAISIDFEECFSGTETVKCNSLGGSTGTILMDVDVLTVLDDLTTLTAANLMTILPESGDHIECSALVLLLVKGQFLVLLDGIASGVYTREAELVVNQSRGRPTDLMYWYNGTETSLASGRGLLASKDGGTLEEAGFEAENGRLRWSQEVRTRF